MMDILKTQFWDKRKPRLHDKGYSHLLWSRIAVDWSSIVSLVGLSVPLLKVYDMIRLSAIHYNQSAWDGCLDNRLNVMIGLVTGK